MVRKLYVGNQSYDVDSGGVEQVFEPFGSVQSEQNTTGRDTSRAKGFGFVEMDSDQEAKPRGVRPFRSA